jgi:hypothetical protein
VDPRYSIWPGWDRGERERVVVDHGLHFPLLLHLWLRLFFFPRLFFFTGME